jgi:hypothetical protein
VVSVRYGREGYRYRALVAAGVLMFNSIVAGLVAIGPAQPQAWTAPRT